jgi:ketosteroid isomerase-like protein
MSSDKEKDKEAIKKWVESMFSYMHSNDLDNFLSLVAEDVILLPPNMQSIHGIEAVKDLIQPWFESLVMTHEIGEIEVKVDSSLAYVRIELRKEYGG